MNYYYYQIYGLTIQSTVNIPQLIAVENKKGTDITVTFQQTKTENTYPSEHQLNSIYTSYGLAANQLPYFSVWKQPESHDAFLIIRYNNGTNTVYFISNQNATQLRVLYHPDIVLNDVCTYLLGPVIGCILRLKNKVCLHASVVSINNQAVAFIGEKTAGKSTLMAHLAAKGYPVLSDDIAVLFEKNKQFWVQSGYPRLRLWRKSLEQFPEVPIEQLQRVLTHVDKYYLPLSVHESAQWNFQTQPLPLKAVIYLQPRNVQHQLTLDSYSPLEGFLYLKKNIYAEYMLTGTLLAKEFSIFGEVSQNTPVLSLKRPDDLAFLDDTIDLITKRLKQY